MGISCVCRIARHLDCLRHFNINIPTQLNTKEKSIKSLKSEWAGCCEMTKSTLMKIWIILSAVWVSYFGSILFRIIHGFNVPFGELKYEYFLFHIIPLFLVPPFGLGIFFWALLRFKNRKEKGSP